MSGIGALNARSREILQHIVDTYVETGEPIGSRTISRRIGDMLSPATIRNVMADLEEAGLLYAPHTSAGRLPTDQGLRIVVDGLLEIGGDLTEDERGTIDSMLGATGRGYDEVLEEATSALAGLSACAGLVISPKSDPSLRHIEFVPLTAGRALVVLVNELGLVENRVIELPPEVSTSVLVQATNFLNTRFHGASIDHALKDIKADVEQRRSELDELTARVVENGLALLAGGGPDSGSLIVRGQSKLLDDVNAVEDLERIRLLFDQLEQKQGMLRLLQATGDADGVQIFIGAENQLFDHTGCSMILSPYRDTKKRVVGAIGVIGPTRMNYARIIPMVDYTARLIGRVIG